MEKEKIIKSDVFKCDLHIIVTEDANDSIDSRNLRIYADFAPGEDVMKDTDGFVFRSEISDYYVILPPNVGFDTIAHESVHIIGRVFRDRDARADYNNDELFAYHVGWIAGIIAEEVEEAYNAFSDEDKSKGDDFIRAEQFPPKVALL
jgi:hypothetical protein